MWRRALFLWIPPPKPPCSAPGGTGIHRFSSPLNVGPLDWSGPRCEYSPQFLAALFPWGSPEPYDGMPGTDSLEAGARCQRLFRRRCGAPKLLRRHRCPTHVSIVARSSTCRREDALSMSQMPNSLRSLPLLQSRMSAEAEQPSSGGCNKQSGMGSIALERYSFRWSIGNSEQRPSRLCRSIRKQSKVSILSPIFARCLKSSSLRIVVAAVIADTASACSAVETSK